MEGEGRGEDGQGSLHHTLSHVTTHPQYLLSNSTSHVWAFGALAELIDNSYDAKAKELHVSLGKLSLQFAVEPDHPPIPRAYAKRTTNEEEDEEETERSAIDTDTGTHGLILYDDGEGMSPLALHRMLSFGHCDKTATTSSQPIGHYGNGFKSGSMRLGDDAFVFTCDGKTKSIGFLSQTFLKAKQSKEVLVPIIAWRVGDETRTPMLPNFYATKLELHKMNPEVYRENIEAMTKYSPFSEADLKTILASIRGKGTKVIIFNMRRDTHRVFELYATQESTEPGGSPPDIRIIDELRPETRFGRTPPAYHSLRQYLAILYLVPRLKAWIQGEPVITKQLKHHLYQPQVYRYRPRCSSVPLEVIYGFNKISKDEQGMMLYHRGRLIRMYYMLGVQLGQSSVGKGVIGIVNANFLQPTHNKQDFIFDNNLRTLTDKLKQGLSTYCRVTVPTGGMGAFRLQMKNEIESGTAGPYFMQCTKCNKWRQFAQPITTTPIKWKCSKGTISCTKLEEPYIIPPLMNIKQQKKTKSKKQALLDIKRETEAFKKKQESDLLQLRALKVKELVQFTGFDSTLCQEALSATADDYNAAAEWLFSGGFAAKAADAQDEELNDENDKGDAEPMLVPRKRKRSQGAAETETCEKVHDDPACVLLEDADSPVVDLEPKKRIPRCDSCKRAQLHQTQLAQRQSALMAEIDHLQRILARMNAAGACKK